MSKTQVVDDYLKETHDHSSDQHSDTFLDHSEPPKFRKSLYISAIVAAIGGFITGYDTGAVSGILAMPTFTDNFFTDDNLDYLQGLLLALFLMTAALGSFTSGHFCGRICNQ